MRIERTSLDAAKEMREVADDFEQAVDLLSMFIEIDRGMVPHRVIVAHGVRDKDMSVGTARAVVTGWAEAFVEKVGGE
jgi:hypothetical protein